MSADQIAEIAPLVREVLQAAGDPNLCATFEVVGNSDAWVQVTAESINVAYPSSEEPLLHLGALVSAHPCSGVIAFEPTKFLTLSFHPDRPQVIARFVDALLSSLFGLGDYSVNGSIEEL